MKIEKAEKGMRVICPNTGEIGKIITFKMSKSGLVRTYIDIELGDGSIINKPLDLVIKY